MSEGLRRLIPRQGSFIYDHVIFSLSSSDGLGRCERTVGPLVVGLPKSQKPEVIIHRFRPRRILPIPGVVVAIFGRTLQSVSGKTGSVSGWCRTSVAMASVVIVSDTQESSEAKDRVRDSLVPRASCQRERTRKAGPAYDDGADSLLIHLAILLSRSLRRYALSSLVCDFQRHVRHPSATLENSGHCISNEIALYRCELMWSSAAPKLIEPVHVFLHLEPGELKVLPRNVIRSLANRRS